MDNKHLMGTHLQGFFHEIPLDKYIYWSGFRVGGGGGAMLRLCAYRVGLNLVDNGRADALYHNLK